MVKAAWNELPKYSIKLRFLFLQKVKQVMKFIKHRFTLHIDTINLYQLVIESLTIFLWMMFGLMAGRAASKKAQLWKTFINPFQATFLHIYHVHLLLNREKFSHLLLKLPTLVSPSPSTSKYSKFINKTEKRLQTLVSTLT